MIDITDLNLHRIECATSSQFYPMLIFWATAVISLIFLAKYNGFGFKQTIFAIFWINKFKFPKYFHLTSFIFVIGLLAFWFYLSNLCDPRMFGNA